MNITHIPSLRLSNQQIASTDKKTVQELVGYMGAMQAQDYNQAKWAVGIRMPHLSEAQIEDAFNRGEIIRTHAMRPTWHFVAADDIYWMLELTARQIRSAMKSRYRELELDEGLLKQSQEIMAESLEGNRALSRDDLNLRLNEKGIRTNEQRASHILMTAEIDGVICSGGIQGKQQTYALLTERVPEKKILHRDEALAELAKKYFTSHGPATLPDFIWWAGLPTSEARKALEMIKPLLYAETIDNETYWFATPPDFKQTHSGSVYLLPAFDEYLISYKNRSAAITADHHRKAISNNGIFRPVIVVDGQISGLWKRTVGKNIVTIELDHFRPHNQNEMRLIARAADAYGNFAEKNVKLELNTP